MRSSSEILLTSTVCRQFFLTSKSLRLASRWSFHRWHQMKKILQMSISLNLIRKHLTSMVSFTLAMFIHLEVYQRFTRSISQGFTASAQELYAISRRFFQLVLVTLLKHLALRFIALVAKRSIYQSLDKLILTEPTSEQVFLMFSSSISPTLS